MNKVWSLTALTLQLIIEAIILHSSWLLSTLSPMLHFYFCDQHLEFHLGNISSLCTDRTKSIFLSNVDSVELIPVSLDWIVSYIIEIVHWLILFVLNMNIGFQIVSFFSKGSAFLHFAFYPLRFQFICGDIGEDIRLSLKS